MKDKSANSVRKGYMRISDTVSDQLYRPEMLSPEDRQLGFYQMITIALDTAASMGI